MTKKNVAPEVTDGVERRVSLAELRRIEEASRPKTTKEAWQHAKEGLVRAHRAFTMLHEDTGDPAFEAAARFTFWMRDRVAFGDADELKRIAPLMHEIEKSQEAIPLGAKVGKSHGRASHVVADVGRDLATDLRVIVMIPDVLPLKSASGRRAADAVFSRYA